MREIKFRGISQYTGEMVYGQLLRGDNNFSIVVNFRTVGTIQLEPIIKGTQSQYTGLKDVNGVEIYEGDIVKFTNGIDEVYEEVGTVVFDLDECGYKAQYSKGSTVHSIYLINPKAFSDRFYEISYEVIGNIYENPNLIK